MIDFTNCEINKYKYYEEKTEKRYVFNIIRKEKICQIFVIK